MSRRLTADEARDLAADRIEALRRFAVFAAIGDPDSGPEDDPEPLPHEFEVELYYDQLSESPSLIAPGLPQRSSFIRFERFAAGDTLVRQGELTTEFFVLLDGLAYAIREGAGRQGRRLETYEPGAWFGEASALSNSPSIVTVRMEQPGEAAILDARLFRRLYDDEILGAAFAGMVDRKYAETTLRHHLDIAPLFAGLADADLDALRAAAEFIPLKGGAVIAREGDEADAFYLVRTGGVKCSRGDGHGVFAYYMSNSSFGEHAVVPGTRWPGTYETMMWTDVVKIPLGVFRDLERTVPALHARLRARAETVVRELDFDELYERSRGADPLYADELDVMVGGQSVKGGRALIIDRDLCIRCNFCVESCAAVHGDHVPRLSKVGHTISTNEMLINACYHCAAPECMAECPYGAIRRDAQGAVHFVYDNCVGCAACTKGCPYGVIRMTEPHREEPAARRPGLAQALLEGLPLIGRFLRRERPAPCRELKVTEWTGEVTPVGSKAVKCDLCAGLPFEACVYNCPTSAIHRRAPSDLFARESLSEVGSSP